MLGEFLDRKAEFHPPRLSGHAMLHAHCHQRAIGDTAHDHRVLQRLGLDVDVLDAGCCGLAGSFGYEADHYDVSMKAGEHALLPAVRGASKETLVVADGFSCRTQVAHGTRRRALHLAEVIVMAMREGSAARPEQRTLAASRGRAAAALAAGGLLAAGGAVWAARHRRGHARAD